MPPNREVSVPLTAGIVAYNEERHVASAVRSLLNQELPSGTHWEGIWVIASGCTDRTADAARSVDPRVQVVVEPERRGKAAALVEIFRRAGPGFLVLLNADAKAAPGAVAALLKAADGAQPPFAVMGRPMPTALRHSTTGDAVDLLWEVHHRFHAWMAVQGLGANLSDELLLLPTANLPPLTAGVVNDGGFIGAWLARSGGQLRYAPEAQVAIEVPGRFRDYLAQRRRIRYGLHQTEEMLGIPPTTLQRYLLRHPRSGFRLLAGATRSRPRGMIALAWLVAAETTALALTLLDALQPEAMHVRWEPIPD